MRVPHEIETLGYAVFLAAACSLIVQAGVHVSHVRVQTSSSAAVSANAGGDGLWWSQLEDVLHSA